MDLTQLANLGEFIGGVAVLVTLIYLAVQIRSGAQEQRMSSTREATREIGSFVQSISSSQDRAELWLKGLRDFEGLGATERARFSPIIGHLFRLYEQLYYQSRDRRVEPEVWQGIEHQLHDLAAYPGFETWWSTRSHWYGDHFRSFVESHISADNQPRLYGESNPAGAGS